MKINFILPIYPNKPSGGHKVLYQYANLFAQHGHDVQLYHILTLPYLKFNLPHWIRIIRSRIFYNNGKPNWFPFDSRIKSHNLSTIKIKSLRPADATITTMWATVLELDRQKFNAPNTIDLIQGYDTWFGDIEKIHDSYHSKIKHVTISNYLADIIEKESGKRPAIIPNAIDEKFKIKNAIEERDNLCIAMLYSPHSYKGSEFGIKALEICKKQVAGLRAKIFSVFPRPEGLPEWIEFYQKPQNLCELYNSASIHISPSINDGWDLPCTEAMACGCALVCTEIGGHSEYAINQETALTAISGNAEDLAEKIIILLNDSQYRIAIAKRGNEFVKKYSWEKSYDKLLKCIQQE